MARSLEIKGRGTTDEMKRYDALKKMQDGATTEELVKLAKLMDDPDKRGLLAYA